MNDPQCVTQPAYGGRPGQRVEEQGTWASQKHSEAGYRRPVDRGAWTAKTVKRPRQQPAHSQYANYWAPLTRKRHTMPHSAQPQHTNYWAPRTRKRHQQEHRPQRPTECGDPTQHVKARTGDCPGPHTGATTRRNVTQRGFAFAFKSKRFNATKETKGTIPACSCMWFSFLLPWSQARSLGDLKIAPNGGGGGGRTPAERGGRRNGLPCRALCFV